jgi:phage terminase Nu1 subunit (DNA packaging protein)
MSGALVYHLNVYRLARNIATLEERIHVTAEILASIPIDTARTRHELFREHIDFLEHRLKILRQRYAIEVSRIR